jgi:hypothetical protein
VTREEQASLRACAAHQDARLLFVVVQSGAVVPESLSKSGEEAVGGESFMCITHRVLCCRIPVLQMGKLRHREIKQVTQGAHLLDAGAEVQTKGCLNFLDVAPPFS